MTTHQVSRLMNLICYMSQHETRMARKEKQAIKLDLKINNNIISINANCSVE